MAKTYSLGIDYGTNSVRALVVDTDDGAEVGMAVSAYPSGEKGIVLDDSDPNLARQAPRDYLVGLRESVTGAVAEAKRNVGGFDVAQIVGIGVDGTGSTPMPIDAEGRSLTEQDRFRDDPNAMAWLWKDHTGHAEAEAITDASESQGLPYMRKVGGVYSSEWFWSKLWRCAKVAPEVFEAADSWVELHDFVPGYLTGRRSGRDIPRGVCAAGHKALWSSDWDGLPSEAFLTTLDPRLGALRSKLFDVALPSDRRAGELTAEVAAELGLAPGTAVAYGTLDAHAGAVGSAISTGRMVKILGTSSCDLLVGEGDVPDVPGMCGVVPGSVLPDRIAIEAGQSAVGDIFNWMVDKLCPATYPEGHASLTEAADQLKPGESGLLALDWNNGNRTVLVDPLLTGLIVGQTLQTTAHEIYRALIEATAFGSKTIVNRLVDHGVPIKEVVTGGGIAERNPMVMQIYADVHGLPFRLSASQQTSALGAAIFGAVVGGAHQTVDDAVLKMAHLKNLSYEPQAANQKVYDEIFRLYTRLHDGFGVAGTQSDLSMVMKDLIRIRESNR